MKKLSFFCLVEIKKRLNPRILRCSMGGNLIEKSGLFFKSESVQIVQKNTHFQNKQTNKSKKVKK